MFLNYFGIIEKFISEFFHIFVAYSMVRKCSGFLFSVNNSLIQYRQYIPHSVFSRGDF